jgi:hypothetical protein
MTWKEYIEEIELIEKQNNVEHDLYNIIFNILKERKAFKKISVRNVCDRKRTIDQDEFLFWGIKGFPDFVLIDKEYGIKEKTKNMILGALEAKYVGVELLLKDEDKSQLIGHLLWFKYVIYTNGIEWRIYNCDWYNVSEKGIDDLQKETYSIRGSKQEVKEKWENVNQRILKQFNLQDLKPKCFILRKVDKYNNIKWDYSEWKKLIKYLNHIKF